MVEDQIEKVRAEVKDRVELPGMTLMEHLDELRKRIIRALVWLLIGIAATAYFNGKIIHYLQLPLLTSGLKMTQQHPTEAIELDIKVAIFAGTIVASPFIIYQFWLFIAPGMYSHEKKYVFPFMSSTVLLFLGGAWFGYRWVLPGAIKVLILGFGREFNHMITIDEYTSFFLSLILGLGACFELPIVMFFVALFGLVDHKFFIKQWRYAILVIFIIAACLCPDPSPIGMGIFASPMMALYIVGIVAAYYVHPSRRKAKELKAA